MIAILQTVARLLALAVMFFNPEALAEDHNLELPAHVHCVRRPRRGEYDHEVDCFETARERMHHIHLPHLHHHAAYVCRDWTTDVVAPDAHGWQCDQCGCETVEGTDIAEDQNLILVEEAA